MATLKESEKRHPGRLFLKVRFFMLRWILTVAKFCLCAHVLYYYMRNFCNFIGLEQWRFSLF